MHISNRKQRKISFISSSYYDEKKNEMKKKIQTNIDSNKLISGRMVKLGPLQENCSFLF